MTSVKEFRVETEPTEDALGAGSFVFTDDYSVFDWGEMPDTIPRKGAGLCSMGAANFELLEERGVATHYRGVVSGSAETARNGQARGPPDGEIVPLADAAEPPIEMAIDLTRVPDLPHDGRTYDYDAFHEAAGSNYLIPLEIVFRNGAPVGSSLRRRTDPADHGLDFETWPDEAVELDHAVVEFSTKFEKGDRYLPREEAARIAGRADLDDLEAVAREVNRAVTERAADAGLVHEDGKIECLYFDGEIRVADVAGTFDENRFSYEGQQVSKECLRQYHKRTQPEWVEAVAAAKAEAKRRGVADWKSLCDADPKPLPERVIAAAGDLYAAGTNAYLGRELFDAPSLGGAIETVCEL